MLLRQRHSNGCVLCWPAWLLQVDRRRTPWVLAGLHRQMVGPTSDPVNVKNLARLQAELEGLFLQHRVDLLLQGESCWPARNLA